MRAPLLIARGVPATRFADDPDLLAGWRSAGNVFGPSLTAEKITAPDTASSGGEGRSAA
jgi:hypothetical protein